MQQIRVSSKQCGATHESVNHTALRTGCAVKSHANRVTQPELRADPSSMSTLRIRTYGTLFRHFPVTQVPHCTSWVAMAKSTSSDSYQAAPLTCSRAMMG